MQGRPRKSIRLFLGPPTGDQSHGPHIEDSPIAGVVNAAVEALGRLSTYQFDEVTEESLNRLREAVSFCEDWMGRWNDATLMGPPVSHRAGGKT